ncbi:MAG: restriction endonuclease subunit S [Selenomonadaceae bacterium]|nr:restriction endonuclease subunit S [Selenomonadaceae bacterium]
MAKVTKLAGFEFTKYVTYSDSGNIIALRGLNVKDGHLVLNDLKYIDNSDLSMLSRSKLKIDDMLFTYVGTVGQVALIDENDKYYLAPNVALIRLNSKKFRPRYMMYYFLSGIFENNQINRLLQASSMKNIPMEKIRQFKLPQISLEKQDEIISILDRFNKLTNDLTEGLPAEIAARRAQYEYYRDKLLHFEEAKK